MEAKKCEKTGIYYYEDLPENVRVATKFDFFTGEKLKVGSWFLLQSFHSRICEAHKIHENFKFEKIRSWLEAGKIFVKK